MSSDTRRITKTTVLFVVAVAALLIARQLFSSGLPVFVRGSYFDDTLTLRVAEGLLDGDWLGAYDDGTLMKGCFASLFMAGIHALGLPYLETLTAVYSIACVFFVSQMRYLLRNRWLLLVLLAVLLFNPGSYAVRTFQALYRNGLAAPQVLLLYGALFGLWLDFGSHTWKDIVRAIIAGAVLWAFWNTREDAAWVVPFVVVALVLVLGKALRRFAREKKVRDIAVGVLVFILPFSMLVSGNALIAAQNERHYGVEMRLECVDGSFADAMRSIYSVKDEAGLQYVSVSPEKLQKLYEVSPTLASIKTDLDERYLFYAGVGRFRQRGVAEDGWFLWALRHGAFTAGKTTTLADSEAFYRQLSLEIDDAVASGALEGQETMPSALMSPWRDEYAGQMLRAIPRTVYAVLSFVGAEASASNTRSQDVYLIEKCETMSRGRVIALEDTSSEYALGAAASAARANAVSKVFQTFNPPFGLAAAVVYVVFLLSCIRREGWSYLPLFLVVFGMALSILVMAIGVAYTDISAFSAMRCTYLAGSYPLALSCIWLTLLCCLEAVLDGRKGFRADNSSSVSQ